MVKVKPPHSYLVDRRDGSVRKVHANKIRQFVVRVQGCGVIAGKDAEFGRVLTPVPVVSSVLLSGIWKTIFQGIHVSRQQLKTM